MRVKTFTKRPLHTVLELILNGEVFKDEMDVEFSRVLVEPKQVCWVLERLISSCCMVVASAEREIGKLHADVKEHLFQRQITKDDPGYEKYAGTTFARNDSDTHGKNADFLIMSLDFIAAKLTATWASYKGDPTLTMPWFTHEGMNEYGTKHNPFCIESYFFSLESPLM